ncbi:DUF4405 domain-containing protein [archaeon]|nr:DUF4405 domain-containing protein [archaeon]
MEKTKINYWIDVGLAISFLAVFITGISKWKILIRLFGFRYSDFPTTELTFVHVWSGIIMGLLVFVHLALHWKWIVCMTKKMFRRADK